MEKANLGKGKKVSQFKKVTAKSQKQETKPMNLTFDPTKTLTALRTLAKKRDPILRKITIEAYKHRLKSPPKAQPVPSAVQSFSFRSSLPIRATEEARERIRQLRLKGATKILFPHLMKGKSKVMYLDKNGKKQLLGIFRAGIVQVESDPKKMDISHLGLHVRVLESNKDLLEFILKAPGLPGFLRSRKLNDQGGLTHQLKVSRVYVKKGG